MNKKVTKHGYMQGDVLIRGQIKQGKTLFPEYLTESQIFDDVIHVLDNPVQSVFDCNRWTIEGFSPRDGTRIVVILEKDGSYVTSFPDLKKELGAL